MKTIKNKKRIVIAGGSGLMGHVLLKPLQDNGYKVVVLTRRNPEKSYEVQWDGENIGPWAKYVDGSYAVINLSGRSVDCRYTDRRKKEIYDSRLKPTAAIVKAIQQAKEPPEVLLNASTATIYRDEREKPNTEYDNVIGTGFSVDVARKWEAVVNNADLPNTRTALLRTTFLLSSQGGAFSAMANLVRMGLGAKMGKGDQWISWIHEEDLIRAVLLILQDESLEGPVNLASPNAVRNADFMKLMRAKLHRPWILPNCKRLLEIGAFFMRTETELILKSRWIRSEKLKRAGFKFNFPDIDQAMDQLLINSKR